MAVTPKVLVTVPVKDEKDRLIPALNSLQHSFDQSGLDYRLSVAEDGSTDGTKVLLPTLPNLFPGIIIQDRPQALGRGKALRMLWSSEPADIYCFCDVDLASGAASVVAAAELIKTGADVVTGSRYVPGASVNRPPVRSFVSRTYNRIVRLWFRDGIHDHQCGLKGFNSSTLEIMMNLTQEDSWFWDTETLVVASHLGLKVVEMPVNWVERKINRTPINRLLSDILLHGGGLLRLKARQARIREYSLRHPDPLEPRPVNQ